MGMGASYNRLWLAGIMEQVRKVTTAAERKAAWGYSYRGVKDGEFHGPNGFYWNGQANSVTEAKAKGWLAYLDKLERKDDGTATG